MMGPRQEAQSALFYDFPIDGHVPVDHVLRAIDGVPDHSWKAMSACRDG
jgi:hypothetical protein